MMQKGGKHTRKPKKQRIMRGGEIDMGMDFAKYLAAQGKPLPEAVAQGLLTANFMHFLMSDSGEDNETTDTSSVEGGEA